MRGVAGRQVVPGDLTQAVNGQTIQDWDSLLDAVEALPPGSTVGLDIQRGDRQMRVALRLETARG